MSETFRMEVATPERLLLAEDAQEAQIPAANGYLGILPGHAPLMAELGTGELSVKVHGRTLYIAVSGGWVEVLPDHVRVLATLAEASSDIDLERAQAALRRAEERLKHPEPGVDVARALNALKRARARLDAASHK
jgi:F-type H+-transporting ATPase subunit epsilon